MGQGRPPGKSPAVHALEHRTDPPEDPAQYTDRQDHPYGCPGSRPRDRPHSVRGPWRNALRLWRRHQDGPVVRRSQSLGEIDFQGDYRRIDDRVHSAGMSPADRFAQLPTLLAADDDLKRRGRWLGTDCRIDVGSEPFFLVIREGALAT